MKPSLTYGLATAAVVLATTAFVYAGGACGWKAASRDEAAVYGKGGTCGSATAAECATKCTKGCYCDTSCPGKETAEHGYRVIDTASLKALLASGEPVTVVDARSGKYDDGRRIAGAISLPANASDEAIARALPDKQAKIVTYCSNTKCPASAKLAKRLVALGYTNVHKYPDGIAGWTAAGNPVSTVAAK
ncbi:MAG: rhodanese-like domain-containing protein [bacterium]|nr:rhodanese-like domain-containing protein [bacterium]